MNVTLLEEKIETFHCNIDNAYGAIACVRVSAENTTDQEFKNFVAELYGIEHYLKLLSGILHKEIKVFGRAIDQANMLMFYKNLKRVHLLIDAYVVETPVNDNTIDLHHRAIGAVFAAINIVHNLKDEFSIIMGEEHEQAS